MPAFGLQVQALQRRWSSVSIPTKRGKLGDRPHVYQVFEYRETFDTHPALNLSRNPRFMPRV